MGSAARGGRAKGGKSTRRKSAGKRGALKRQPASRHSAHPQRAKTDKQITVQLPNKPGELAKLGRVLKRAGVNMLAMAVNEQADTSAVRFVVDNRAAAVAALETAGIKHALRSVLLVRAANSPGVLGDLSAKLARQKINIEYAYASTHPDALQALVVLAVNRTREAARVLG